MLFVCLPVYSFVMFCENITQPSIDLFAIVCNIGKDFVKRNDRKGNNICLLSIFSTFQWNSLFSFYFFTV